MTDSNDLPGSVRARVRALQLSHRTEEAYVHWARRFEQWSGGRPPAGLGAHAVQSFLDHLGGEKKLSPASRRQARSALAFLYREVLGLDASWLARLACPPGPLPRAPALSPEQKRRLLEALPSSGGRGCTPEGALLARLVAATGWKLAQLVALRIQDIDLEAGCVAQRVGSAGRVRKAQLPAELMADLRSQWHRAHNRWRADGTRWMDAQHETAAEAGARPSGSWGRYWLFPAAMLSRDPASGATRRPHVTVRRIHRELQRAAESCGIEAAHVLHWLAPAVEASLPAASGSAPAAGRPVPGIPAFRRRSVHEDQAAAAGEDPFDLLGSGTPWSVREPAPAWNAGHAAAPLERPAARSLRPHGSGRAAAACRPGCGVRRHAFLPSRLASRSGPETLHPGPTLP